MFFSSRERRKVSPSASGLACKIDVKETHQDGGREGRGICSSFDAVTMWPVRVSTPPIWLLLKSFPSSYHQYSQPRNLSTSKTHSCADEVFQGSDLSRLSNNTTHGGRGELSWRGSMWLRDLHAVPYFCSRDVLQYKVGLKYIITLDSRLALAICFSHRSLPLSGRL